MWRILVLALAIGLCPVSPSAAQVEYGGQYYSHRQCSNPWCRMCNTIERKLAAQRSQRQSFDWSQVQTEKSMTVVQQPTYRAESTAVVTTPAAVSSPAPVLANSIKYEQVTTYEQRTQQVCQKDIWGRCHWTTQTYTVPVTKWVPVQTTASSKTVGSSEPTKSLPKVSVATDPPRAEEDLDDIFFADEELVVTPQPVVDAMLAALDPPSKATLFDLGCGDGRFLITAAKYYGCTCVGIELNTETLKNARRHIRSEFVAPLIVLFNGNILDYDLASAEYVVMYLHAELMEKAVKKLRPGTKIASYSHEIPGVEENQRHELESGEVFFTGVVL